MKASNTVEMKHANGVTIGINLDETDLSGEQKAIVQKLFSEMSGKEVDPTRGNCEEGNCLASNFLSPDEFKKIQGVKIFAASNPSPTPTDFVICDLCLDCYQL